MHSRVMSIKNYRTGNFIPRGGCKGLNIPDRENVLLYLCTLCTALLEPTRSDPRSSSHSQATLCVASKLSPCRCFCRVLDHVVPGLLQNELSPPPAEEHESDYRQEPRKSSWAACIKRIYEINPLECPKCKSQMRIIAFIQDAHSIKDIMKSQGIPDFQAPPPIPKFIDTLEALDELPCYDSFEPAPDEF